MKKNIILLVMDTARAQNFPFYGYDRDTAPFLSKLAEESQTYENVYSQALWTLPSHMSIFTGKYSKDHGAVSKDFRLEENPLLEQLNDQGYETIGISNNTYISEEFGFGKYFDYFRRIKDDLIFVSNEEPEIWEKLREMDSQNVPKHRKYSEFCKHCLKNLEFKELLNGLYYLLNKKYWIGDQGARNSNTIAKRKIEQAEQPFFLFINYIEPHTPYKPPRKYKREFLPDQISNEEIKKNLNFSADEALKGEVEITEKLIEIQESLYDAEIKYLDSRIEELYNYLENKDLLEDTVLIITSDHGEYFGERGLYRHSGELGPEVLNVPLIIKTSKSTENQEGVFELRQLFDYIKNTAKDSAYSLEPKEKAYSEYYLWHDSEDEELESRYKKYQASITDASMTFTLNEDGDTTTIQRKVNLEEIDTLEESLKKKFKRPLEDPESIIPDKKRAKDEKIMQELEKLGYK